LAAPARRHAVSDIYTTDHNRLPSVDCDTFGLTANVSGIKVWVIPLQTCCCCGWLPMVVGPRRWWLLLADGISPLSSVLSLLVVAPHHRWYLPISWHSWSHCRRHSPGVVVVSPLTSPVPAGCFPAFSRNPPGLGWCSPRFSWWSSHCCFPLPSM
jgi:hypothetical protein